MRCVLLLVALTLASPRAEANLCGPVPDTLILLDRSGSMKEMVGTQSKWVIAVDAVNAVTNNFTGQLNFGLMLFSRWPHVSNCSSGQINVGVGSYTAGAIASTLSSTYPAGDTPIALSLDAARSYLSGIYSGKAQYVILITDGMETCQPVTVNSPPAAAAKLLGNGVKTYVVGFGSGVDPQSLNDTALAGGTGSYYQADNLTQLDNALKQIAAQITCCGDAKVDPGETCDTGIPVGQPGSCPAFCNDGNSCTKDSLSGSACNVTCSFVPITASIHGDGCCPPGATSATDNDCAPACGNGVLDPGENCDTGIPAGMWGGCPTTCDDGNTCTQDSMVGSGCFVSCTHVNTCPTNTCGDGKLDPGEWCDVGIPAGAPGSCPMNCNDGNPCTKDALMGTGCLAKCSNVPITTPFNNDGCCPAGATSQVDNDCPASCGDGKLDPGESCDPGIPSGPGSCLQDCNDNNPCTHDFLTGAACDVSCGHNPVGPNPTQPDGCCPAGMTLNQDPDCLPPCGPDKNENCVDPCQGVTCPDGQYCKDGGCVPWPADPNDSTEGSTGDLNTFVPGDTAGGCDCRVGGGVGAEAPVTALLLALFFLVRRRRRGS